MLSINEQVILQEQLRYYPAPHTNLKNEEVILARSNMFQSPSADKVLIV